MLEQLYEFGIDISSGNLSNIITEGKDRYHSEKDEILATGLEISAFIQVDDTGARHIQIATEGTLLGSIFEHGFNRNMIISDDAGQFNILTHALCWVHAKRTFRNLSERDIREYVKRRKVSGSTRSSPGRKCRDTFTSLKKHAES